MVATATVALILVALVSVSAVAGAGAQDSTGCLSITILPEGSGANPDNPQTSIAGADRRNWEVFTWPSNPAGNYWVTSFSVDWGDGTTSTEYTEGDRFLTMRHTFPAGAGSYTITGSIQAYSLVDTERDVCEYSNSVTVTLREQVLSDPVDPGFDAPTEILGQQTESECADSIADLPNAPFGSADPFDYSGTTREQADLQLAANAALRHTSADQLRFDFGLDDDGEPLGGPETRFCGNTYISIARVYGTDFEKILTTRNKVIGVPEADDLRDHSEAISNFEQAQKRGNALRNAAIGSAVFVALAIGLYSAGLLTPLVTAAMNAIGLGMDVHTGATKPPNVSDGHKALESVYADYANSGGNDASFYDWLQSQPDHDNRIREAKKQARKANY